MWRLSMGSAVHASLLDDRDMLMELIGVSLGENRSFQDTKYID